MYMVGVDRKCLCENKKDSKIIHDDREGCAICTQCGACVGVIMLHDIVSYNDSADVPTIVVKHKRAVSLVNKYVDKEQTKINKTDERSKDFDKVFEESDFNESVRTESKKLYLSFIENNLSYTRKHCKHIIMKAFIFITVKNFSHSITSNEYFGYDEKKGVKIVNEIKNKNHKLTIVSDNHDCNILVGIIKTMAQSLFINKEQRLCIIKNAKWAEKQSNVSHTNTAIALVLMSFPNKEHKMYMKKLKTLKYTFNSTMINKEIKHLTKCQSVI